MSRKPRLVIPGVPQHVIQRGNNCEPCFYLEQDYFKYLDNLHEAAIDNELQSTPRTNDKSCAYSGYTRTTA